MMEKDDAVSTVIALMLILGIISTLIAIYSAVYLPGLKQQSEIEHSHEVVDAFARFGSDIEYVVSQKKPARFSEPFSLGGGGILLSPIRSSGSLTITQAEKPLMNVTVENGTQNEMGVASLVNISYVPSFTTWEPQGYRWEYGFIAVTKGDVAVPQSSRYNTISEAQAGSGEFLCSFIDPIRKNGDDIEITLINLLPQKDGWFMTGSGITTLGLNATENPDVTLDKATKITFDLDPEMPGMQERLDAICSQADATYISGSNMLDLIGNPTNVTLRIVNVEVGVW